MTSTSAIKRHQHPCFNAAVKGQFGRVHLPVAPKCNIKCNYCNRKYDCVNESRPGVTSNILTPGQALVYMRRVLELEPRISVAGIAGPGDPFANPAETMETMRLIRRQFPGMILCVATNGLALAPYVDELADIEVSHVTVTINAVEPGIGARIYGWVRDGKVAYRGLEAATLLLARQLEAIRRLKKHGIIVKVNTIVVPGINDGHVFAIAKKMRELGVDLLNCMAMFPNADTPFAGVREPSEAELKEVRKEAEQFLPQMRHCTRCRADAVGLLTDDRTEELRGCLADCARLPPRPEEYRPYVAVATLEGLLVNQHLGEARRLQIWGQEKDQYTLIEERNAPEPGGGVQRWLRMASLLHDCRAVLVSGIGETPFAILKESGIKPVEMHGFIFSGLDALFGYAPLLALKARRQPCGTNNGCPGAGGGCQ